MWSSPEASQTNSMVSPVLQVTGPACASSNFGGAKNWANKNQSNITMLILIVSLLDTISMPSCFINKVFQGSYVSYILIMP